MNQKIQEESLTVPEQTTETPEERAKRVADIKRLVNMGKYHINCQEILYNMLKTAP